MAVNTTPSDADIHRHVFNILKEREKRRLRRLDPLSYACFLPWQDEQFRKGHHCQIIIGSNRSGKTEYGAITAAMFLAGRHPWQTEGFYDTITGEHKFFPMPPHKSGDGAEFQIRIVMTDLEAAFNLVIRPKLERYIPPYLYKNGTFDSSFKKTDMILTLKDGAKVQFMSNRMNIKKFSGASLVMVWHDEQPNQEIWSESVLRTTDKNGMLLITASLNEGAYSWVADLIDDLTANNRVNAQDVDVKKVTIRDNTFIDSDVVNKKSALLSDEERDIKIEGNLGILGLVYSNFKDKEPWVVEDFEIPIDWTLGVIVDYHATKPVCLQHWAIDPDENYWIFREDEIDEQGQTAIVEACRATFCGRLYYHHYIETRGASGRDRLHDRGKSAFDLLRSAGWTELNKAKTQSQAKATACEAGALVLNSLLEKDPKTKLPRLRIFSSCVKTRRDLRRLRKRKSRGNSRDADTFDDTKFDFAACARVGAYQELWFVNRSVYVNEATKKVKDKLERSVYNTGY